MKTFRKFGVDVKRGLIRGTIEKMDVSSFRIGCAFSGIHSRRLFYMNVIMNE